MIENKNGWGSDLGWSLGLAVVYFLIARIGLFFVAPLEGLALCWPASGFMLAVLLLSPRRRWPMLVAGAFLANAVANIVSGNSLAVSLGFACANLFEAIVVVVLLARFVGLPISMSRPRDVVGFTLVGPVAGAGFAALLGALVPFIGMGARYGDVWLVWWIADGIGILIVTPLILVLVEGGPAFKRMTWRRFVEAAILVLLLVVLTWAIFSGWRLLGGVTCREYMVLPFLLWAAVRFGPRGLVLVLMVLVVVSSMVIIPGLAEDLAVVKTRILDVQLFWGFSSFMALFFAAILAELKKAEQYALRALSAMVAADVEKKKAAEMERVYKEQWAAKDLLIQADKLTSLGQLSAGIAHELNNPLTGILGIVRHYMENKDPKGREYGDLKEVVIAAERIAKVVRGLLDFSSPSLGDRQELRCNDIIESVLDFGQKILLGQDVLLQKDYEDGLPLIRGDKNQLQQVVLNIISNSADAMQKQGTLKIATGTIMAHGGRFVEMRFVDSGCGISQEDQRRMFEPFFTTKRPDKGMGLSLPMAYSIIQQHGGEMLVESPPQGQEKGVAFKIRLPVMSGSEG